MLTRNDSREEHVELGEESQDRHHRYGRHRPPPRPLLQDPARSSRSPPSPTSCPGRAKAFAEARGARGAQAFEVHRQLLEKADVEAVSVCTYNMAHREPTVDALGAGKHVLPREADGRDPRRRQAIMRAWEAAKDRILMVGFQPDFGAAVQGGQGGDRLRARSATSTTPSRSPSAAGARRAAPSSRRKRRRPRHAGRHRRLRAPHNALADGRPEAGRGERDDEQPARRRAGRAR